MSRSYQTMPASLPQVRTQSVPKRPSWRIWATITAIVLLTTTLVLIAGSPSASATGVTRAYVSNTNANTVSVLDVPSNTIVATVAVGTTPEGVAINPAGTRAYVANFNSNTVSVIDTATNTVVATVAVGSRPWSVAVNPAGTRAWVTNQGPNIASTPGTVSVVDTATNTVVATLATAAPYDGVGGVAFNQTGTRAYVTNPQSSSLTVFDTATNTIVTKINFFSSATTGAAFVALNAAGTRAYVTNDGGSTVTVIDTVTGTVLTPITVGPQPLGILFNPVNGRLYVAAGSNGASVIDSATNTVIAMDPVGGGLPIGVAVTPDGSAVYVGNLGNRLVAIDTASNAVIASIGMNSPQFLAIANLPGDATPPTCIVTSRERNSVVVAVQDTGSGLATVAETGVMNAMVTVGSFSVGTTSPVSIKVGRIDLEKRSQATIVVTDVAGNKTSCTSFR